MIDQDEVDAVEEMNELFSYLTPEHEEILEQMEDANRWLINNADESIHTVHNGAGDNDIFIWGMKLMKKATQQGKPIYQWDGENHSFYLLGTEEEITARLKTGLVKSTLEE